MPYGSRVSSSVSVASAGILVEPAPVSSVLHNISRLDLCWFVDRDIRALCSGSVYRMQAARILQCTSGARCSSGPECDGVARHAAARGISEFARSNVLSDPDSLAQSVNTPLSLKQLLKRSAERRVPSAERGVPMIVQGVSFRTWERTERRPRRTCQPKCERVRAHSGQYINISTTAGCISSSHPPASFPRCLAAYLCPPATAARPSAPSLAAVL